LYEQYAGGGRKAWDYNGRKYAKRNVGNGMGPANGVAGGVLEKHPPATDRKEEVKFLKDCVERPA
jgi:hypothetical protein